MAEFAVTTVLTGVTQLYLEKKDFSFPEEKYKMVELY